MPENELNALDVQGEAPPLPEPEPESTEAPPETPPVDEAPDPEALKAEIAELQQKKKEAEEAARKWRKEKAEARADYFKSRQETPETPPAAAETARPNPDDFDDYNDYIDKLTDWKVDQKKRAWDQEEAKKAEDQSHQQKMQAMREKINAGFDKYPDFEDVALAQTVPITQMIAEILAETENPADIAYYLGKNQPKAIAIGRMTPIAAARAIAQIEAEITAEPPATQPDTHKTTKAPPPIRPVGSSNTVTKDPEKMSQAEYEEYRRSQGAKPY